MGCSVAVLLSSASLVTSASSDCKLKVAFNAGSNPAYTLECSGTPVAAKKGDEGALADGPFKGIEWIAAECGLPACMITMCGTGDVTFRNSSITGIPPSDSTILCFAGGVSASFQGLSVSNNSGLILKTMDEAKLTILQSTFTQNHGTVLHVAGRSSVRLSEHVIVSNNSAQRAGVIHGDGEDKQTLLRGVSPVVVSDFGKLWVGPRSVFEENNVTTGSGGALSAWGHAEVNISPNHLLGMSDQAWPLDAVEAGNQGKLVTFRQNSITEGSGGAIAVYENATLSISGNVTLQGNVAKHHGGAIVAYNNSKVTISSGVLISENIAKEDSGAGIAVFDDVSLTVFNHVTFQGNVKEGFGKAGGGLSAWDNTIVSLHDSVVFTENVAIIGGSGGALSLAGNSRATVSERCVFDSNKALVNGGGIAVSDRSTLSILDGVLIENNTAGTGGGLHVSDTAKAFLSGNSVLGGNSAGKGGAVRVMSFSTLQAKDNVTFTDNTAKSSGADVLAEVNCTLDLSGSNLDPYRSNTVMWYRKDCILGEHLNDSYCKPCPALTYGLDPSYNACNACPNNSDCTGRDAIIPLAGHWHSHPYSTQIHFCPRQGVCNYAGTCAEGYEGMVCGSCAEGFGSYGPFRCGSCLSFGGTLAAYLGACLVVVLALSLLLQSVLKDMRIVDSSRETCFVRPSDLCKILIRHVQYLAIISTMAIKWPKALAGLFTAATWVFTPSISDVVSLDCLFGAAGSHNLQVAVGKVLLYLLAPVVIFLAVFCFRLLFQCCRSCTKQRRKVPKIEQQQQQQEQQQQHKVSTRSIATLSFLVVLFFFYPFLVRVALGMFTCLPLDVFGPGSHDPYPQYAVANATAGYWVPDMNQACWEGWHRIWALTLGVPAAVIFCVGVPLGMGAVLIAHVLKWRDDGSTLSVCMGFLCHNVRGNRCFWEVVSIVLMAGVTAISVFTYSLGLYYSLVLMVLLFASIFVLQHMAKPYTMKLLNSSASASAACLYVTASIALTFFGGEKEVTVVYSEVMGVVGLMVNAWFIVWCTYLIVRHSSGRVAATLLQVEAWWEVHVWKARKAEQGPLEEAFEGV